MIIDDLLTLILTMRPGTCRCSPSQWRLSISDQCVYATSRNANCPRCEANNHWRSVDAHCQNGEVTELRCISNYSSFRQKHLGVLDGSDGSDGTSHPLTENYTLPVTQVMGRVAYVLLYFVVMFTHHQKDTCITLFAGAAVMLKPFTQRLAMLNHSYYLSFNDFQNLCIQCVFSSMYLCIYIATYLHTVYLDWQHAVVVGNLRCAWRWRTSEVRDTLGGRDRESLDMHFEAVIERVWRCTCRPRSSELRDALRGRERVNSEMQLEAVIERVWRYALGVRDLASLGMHLEAMIVRTWRP